MHTSVKRMIQVALMLASVTAYSQRERVDWTMGSAQPIEFTTPKEADPLLQHSKEVFVLYGCAYCHGIDLHVRNGDSTNLLKSNIVAIDVEGNAIGKILRAGIPQTPALSPMPQFSDLSDAEIRDIARWIHFVRQRERYKDLIAAPMVAASDSSSGKAYFNQNCEACHTLSATSAIVKRYDEATLKRQLLRPPVLLDRKQNYKLSVLNDANLSAAKLRHGALVETISVEEVSNLMSYLKTLR